MTHIYFGAPLFTEAQQAYNSVCAEKIRNAMPTIQLYVPQENGDINDKTEVVKSTDIFEQDTQELLNSSAMIAILDGQDIDSGLAAELGIAYSYGVSIYACYSDIRHQPGMATPNEFGETPTHYINQYVIGLIKQAEEQNGYGGIYSSFDDLVKDLAEDTPTVEFSIDIDEFNRAVEKSGASTVCVTGPHAASAYQQVEKFVAKPMTVVTHYSSYDENTKLENGDMVYDENVMIVSNFDSDKEDIKLAVEELRRMGANKVSIFNPWDSTYEIEEVSQV